MSYATPGTMTSHPMEPFDGKDQPGQQPLPLASPLDAPPASLALPALPQLPQRQGFAKLQAAQRSGSGGTGQHNAPQPHTSAEQASPVQQPMDQQADALPLRQAPPSPVQQQAAEGQPRAPSGKQRHVNSRRQGPILCKVWSPKQTQSMSVHQTVLSAARNCFSPSTHSRTIVAATIISTKRL